MGYDISHDVKGGFPKRKAGWEKSKGFSYNMDCKLAYKAVYHVWDCIFVFVCHI
jgi:hypothetical protein